MDKIFIYLTAIGIIFLSILIIYLLSMPNGKLYTNAVLINIPEKQITNINQNGSYFINVKKHPTIYLFNNYYTVISDVNLNSSFMILKPLNNNYYEIKFGNNSLITPISNNNVTFEVSNSIYKFFEYDNKTKYLFITNETIQKPRSIYSTYNSTIIILNSSIYKTYPITIKYYPNDTQFYQNVSIDCDSNAKFMIMKTNYGINETFNSGNGSINSIAIPDLNISCYNGYSYVTKELNFSLIKPILNLTYNNGTVLCKSNTYSLLYLYVNNNYTTFNSRIIKYNITTKPPFVLKCYTPRSMFQIGVNQILNVS